MHDDAPIRWGILGTGQMAGVFTEDLLRLPGHAVVAVGSRRPETAEKFACRYDIVRAHGSYAALAADDDVDVVYIATTNDSHYSAALTCLEAGRPILMEKPFTVTAAEAERIVDLARKRRLFAMEAMWTRFNPVITRLRTLVSAGAIGEMKAIYADFGFAPAYDPAHRVWSPELAGGALLDLGVYPLSLASMLLGTPEKVRALSTPAATGVDANTAILLGFPCGAIALLHAALIAETPQTATVIGSRGRIEVAAPFFRPASLTVHRPDAAPEEHRIDLLGNGYGYQAEEVARCLRSGRTESPIMPLSATVDILHVLDSVRHAFT